MPGVYPLYRCTSCDALATGTAICVLCPACKDPKGVWGVTDDNKRPSAAQDTWRCVHCRQPFYGKQPPLYACTDCGRDSGWVAWPETREWTCAACTGTRWGPVRTGPAEKECQCGGKHWVAPATEMPVEPPGGSPSTPLDQLNDAVAELDAKREKKWAKKVKKRKKKAAKPLAILQWCSKCRKVHNPPVCEPQVMTFLEFAKDFTMGIPPVMEALLESGDAPMFVEDEASNLVRDGDRQKVYGHPREDYTRTAALWSAWLGDQLRTPLTADQAVMLMALMKQSRLRHSPGHRDTVVDLIGYAICYDRVRNDPPLPGEPEQPPEEQEDP